MCMYACAHACIRTCAQERKRRSLHWAKISAKRCGIRRRRSSNRSHVLPQNAHRCRHACFRTCVYACTLNFFVSCVHCSTPTCARAYAHTLWWVPAAVTSKQYTLNSTLQIQWWLIFAVISEPFHGHDRERKCHGWLQHRCSDHLHSPLLRELISTTVINFLRTANIFTHSHMHTCVCGCLCVCACVLYWNIEQLIRMCCVCTYCACFVGHGYGVVGNIFLCWSCRGDHAAD